MKRREFLKVVGAATGVCALRQTSIFSAGYTNTKAPAETVAGMPRRVLGCTGARVSLVGFPGLALVQAEYDQDRCTQALHDAFAKGINYYDVAPAYGNGKCETRMGIGLQGLDRSQYFLACKTKKRDKDGARQELETSLKLLKTDHFDLYQMHHLRSVEEVKTSLGPGGAIETFLKAKEEGLIKHIGFSSHTTRSALEMMKGFKFDTVMFPINFVELYNRGFGKDVLDLANEQGAAVIAIKPMLYGAWPKDATKTRKWWYRCTETAREVDLAWRFTLSRKGVVAGIPPSWLDLVDKAIEAAKSYRPATEAELDELKKMAVNCPSLFEADDKKYAGTGPHDTHDDGSEYYA